MRPARYSQSELRARMRVLDGQTGNVGKPRTTKAALKVLEEEAYIVLQAARQLGAGVAFGEKERARLRVAQLRLSDACREIYGRA